MILREFLECKGVLEKFKSNMKADGRSIEDINKTLDSKEMYGIGSSFTWFDTNEGSLFWGNLNKEWVDIVFGLEKEKIKEENTMKFKAGDIVNIKPSCHKAFLFKGETNELEVKGYSNAFLEYHIWTKDKNNYWFIREEDLELSNEPSKQHTKQYMVFIQGKCSPKKIHTSLEEAQKELERLLLKEVNCTGYVCELLVECKSKVVLEYKE